jgi:Tfp pilus assembly protein PilX
MPRWNMAAVRSRTLARLRDERGIALVMAIGIMFVLTITVTTVMFFSRASEGHANHSNAGQKAYALAEAGVNNAVAVLNASYGASPPPTFPGDSTLLPTRTTTYDTGTATWSGMLVQTALGTQWPFEWQITSTGTVANPTGPGTTAVSRKASAVVPVVIKPSEDAGGASVLNYIYSLTDLSFLQSVSIETPVYATRDLTLGNTATISAAATTVAVGRNLTLENPGNKVGESGARVPAVYVQNWCKYKNQPTNFPCQWDSDNVFAAGPGPNEGGTTIPSMLLTQIPTLTCCSVPPAVPTSQMGFWYRYASPGPYFPCVTSSGTPPKFDTVSGTPDNTINESAYSTGSPFNLTGAPYSCTTPSGSISWNGTKMTIDGTVYIDGSAKISGSGTYDGVGTIVLSGAFSMSNGDKMCANAACDPTTWNPNNQALVVVANGDVVDDCGNDHNQHLSINIKKGRFQGALIGNKGVDASVTGTQVVGPMISVNDRICAGQGTGASFPPIHFAPSGTGGITSPPPPGMLLSPRNYGGG